MQQLESASSARHFKCTPNSLQVFEAKLN